MKKKRIFQRMLLMLLVLSQLCTVAGAVSLGPYAFTSDDNVYREYAAIERTTAITMETGEYQFISPLHWIHVLYLSYADYTVTSSDESVVTVGYFKNDGTDVGMKFEPGTYYGGDKMGVTLYAVGRGTATVTIQYSTVLFGLGLNYEDRRGDNTFTNIIEVTVDDPELDVDITYSNQSSFPVDSFMLTMKTFNELIPELNEVNNRFMGTDPNKTAKENFEESGYHEFAQGITDDMSDAMKKMGAAQYRNLVLGTTASVGKDMVKATGNMCMESAFFIAKLFRAGMGKVYKLPTASPVWLNVDITVSNPSEIPQKITSLELKGNEYLSFTCREGPWAEKMTLSVGKGPKELGPGESAVFHAKAYPRMVYGTEGDQSQTRFVYTGTVDVTCHYTTKDRPRTVTETAGLEAYTDITRMDLEKFNQALLGQYGQDLKGERTLGELAHIYGRYHFGYGYVPDSIEQFFYIKCPVELVVQSRDGREIAAIGTNGEPYLEEGGLLAGAAGDEKFAVLSPEMAEQYRLLIRAEESGTMEVLTVRQSSGEAPQANLYEKVNIEKGEVYELDWSQDAAVLVKDDKALPPDIAMNREVLTQQVIDAQIVSEEYVEDLTDALSWGLMPESIMESDFAMPCTLEAFSGMLTSIYENLNLIEHEELQEQVCAKYGSEPANAYIGCMIQLGCLDGSYGDLVIAEDAADRKLTAGEMAVMINGLMDLLGLDDDRTMYQSLVMRSDDAVGELQDSDLLPREYQLRKVLDMGVLDKAAPETVTVDTELSLEEAVSAISGLWDYIGLIRNRNIAAEKLSMFSHAELTQKCADFQLPEWQGILSCGAQQAEDRLLSDFAVDFLNGSEINLASKLMTINVYNALFFASKYDDAAELVDCAQLSSESTDAYDGTIFIRGGNTQEGSFRGLDKLTSTTLTNDGRIVKILPFYFIGKEGPESILNQEMYLGIIETSVDTDGSRRFRVSVVGDEQMVVQYLIDCMPIWERNRAVQASDSNYIRLQMGSKGVLAENLAEELGVSFDDEFNQNMSAVIRAYQKYVGLPQTGSADAATLKAIYGNSDEMQIVQEWLKQR